MTNYDPSAPSTPARIMSALRELIAALDRRMPRLERTGETGIARDASTLRREAVSRMEELTRAGLDARREKELGHAVMTDDGGPSPDPSRPPRRA